MTLVPSIKDVTRDINTGVGTSNVQAWVDGVSNEVNIELSRLNSPIGEHRENIFRSIGVEEWASTDLETSLDTEDFLEEFKEALEKYAIAKRFHMMYKRNEPERARAWYKQEGFPFCIYVALDKVDEVENRETWSWFSRNIISDLQLGDGDGFTLMTDQQKGPKEKIVELLPRVEHRACVRHLYAN
ncbi:hypothetical protein V6N12_045341 [Hibiscus sabdariffa]|uniref:Transposase MuDR plant domain-containing protein n=1 Tax=Hibiscus sabdariffa TaxID=183260 RepID=A0ABR2G300_9ROSI